MNYGNRRRVTLDQIARTAGVSISTASRVLAGSGSVSEDLERKVRNAVQRMGANRSSGRRTGLIAILLGNRPILHWFHSHVMLGIEMYLHEQGAGMIVAGLQYGPGVPWNEVPVPRILQSRRAAVDGFVAVGTHSQNLLDLLRHLERPYSVYGNNVSGEWDSSRHDCVFMDDFGGGYDTTRFLVEHGHRNIWFLGNRELPWQRRRHEGYRKALEEYALDPHVSPISSPREQEAGYLAIKSLLNSGVPVDAIFAAGDPAAQGAYEALQERRFRVGLDISVASFDDFPRAMAMNPPLTTVCTFPEEVGRRLAEMVWRRMESPCSPFDNVTVPTRLILRDSVRTVTGRAGEVSEPGRTLQHPAGELQVKPQP